MPQLPRGLSTKVTSIQMLEVPRVQSSEGSDASNQESDFLEGLLGGSFKHLFLNLYICGNDPIWQILFKWVETTN